MMINMHNIHLNSGLWGAGRRKINRRNKSKRTIVEPNITPQYYNEGDEGYSDPFADYDTDDNNSSISTEDTITETPVENKSRELVVMNLDDEVGVGTDYPVVLNDISTVEEFDTIFVPDNLVNDYKKATNWVKLQDKIKPLSENI